MTEDTNGLSREQLRLRVELWHAIGRWVRTLDPSEVESIVVAMLAEACAEVDSRIRKAILQPHVRASTEYGPDYCSTCSEAIHDWVKWPCAATEPARAEAWPCDNYRAPTTCLTAPSSETGRCDWCRTQAEAVRAEERRDALRAYVGPDNAYEQAVTELTRPPHATPGQGEPGGQGEG